MAEAVMRKLYRRTAQLEEQLHAAGGSSEHDGSPTASGPLNAPPRLPTAPAAAGLSNGVSSSHAVAAARSAIGSVAAGQGRLPSRGRPRSEGRRRAATAGGEREGEAMVVGGEAGAEENGDGGNARAGDGGSGASSDGGSSDEGDRSPRRRASRGNDAKAALDEHALFLLESHERRASEMEGALQKMGTHVSQLEARLLQEQAVGDEVYALRLQIASAQDEREALSDRYARMKAEHRALLRSRAASLKGASKTGVAREATALIAELEAHLQRERRENAAHARQLNERLYQQEQRQCDLFVEKRLLEQKVQALSGQIDERDRLETSIEARIFSLFGRLQQLEDTNLRLEVQHKSSDRAEAVGVA